MRPSHGKMGVVMKWAVGLPGAFTEGVSQNVNGFSVSVPEKCELFISYGL